MMDTIEPTQALPQAHPDYLRALVSWFGVTAAAGSTARILDIGCGSGSHLLGLAARLPRAKLVGIDVDESSIRLAQQAAEAAGLRNIQFRRADIAELKIKAKIFDYVICHDVFSHVNESCRDAILRQIAHVLDDDGVALVSYDAYPGWKFADWWREMLLLRSSMDSSGGVTLEQAVQRLNQWQEQLPTDERWAAALHELGLMIGNTHPRRALFRILNPDHQALTLSDFMRRAMRAGLMYVGDSQYRDTLQPPLRGEAQQRIMQEYANDLIGRQQYYDYVRNRGQRQTLLIRQRKQGVIDPAHGIKRDALLALQIQGGFQPPMQGQPYWQSVLRPGIKVADKPFVGALCGKLNLAGLSTVSVAALLDMLAEEERDEGARLLLELISVQAVRIFAAPMNIDGRYSSQPELEVYIRSLLPLVAQTRGALGIADAWQQPIAIDPVKLWLMERMDGQMSDIELGDALAEACQNGVFDKSVLASLLGGENSVADWTKMAHEIVERIIKSLAIQGVLCTQQNTVKETSGE